MSWDKYIPHLLAYAAAYGSQRLGFAYAAVDASLVYESDCPAALKMGCRLGHTMHWALWDQLRDGACGHNSIACSCVYSCVRLLTAGIWYGRMHMPRKQCMPCQD